MKQFTGKHSKIISHKKVKLSKKLSLQLGSNHSNYLNQMYFHIFYIPTYQSGINIAHNARGHYGKNRPRVLANHSARYISRSSSQVYNNYCIALR